MTTHTDTRLALQQVRDVLGCLADPESKENRVVDVRISVQRMLKHPDEINSVVDHSELFAYWLERHKSERKKSATKMNNARSKRA